METKTTKTTTTLAKALIYNAGFTTKFINKTQIGDEVFKQWKEVCNDLCKAGYNYYVALDTYINDEEKHKEFKNEVCKVFREKMLVLVGKIPSCDNETITSNINTEKLFLNIVVASVKKNAKNEVKKLVDLRQKRSALNTEYKKNCFTSDGIPKAGLQESYVKSFTDKLKDFDDKIAKMLEVSGNSTFEDKENKGFAKAFEIDLRKEVKRLSQLTAKEVKEEKAKVKQERDKNRKKQIISI